MNPQKKTQPASATRPAAKQAVTANDIQKLREMTGAGVMECKRALIDAAGDFDRAKELINERGLAKVEKRAGRDTGAGIIHSYIHNGRIGVLLDMRAETDFVVRSEPFQKLVHEVAMQISAMAPETVADLLKQPYIRDESKTIEQLVNEVIALVGENIRVNKFSRMEI
ncbi:MAG TPA: translation elongation factor Ts [Candidatus Paceibacterota bacterium]|nr:translation elongation factor Ts [Candidatus Paceibacterota bacterium]